VLLSGKATSDVYVLATLCGDSATTRRSTTQFKTRNPCWGREALFE